MSHINNYCQFSNFKQLKKKIEWYEFQSSRGSILASKRYYQYSAFGQNLSIFRLQLAKYVKFK